MDEEQFCGAGKCVYTYGTKFLTQEYEGSQGYVTQGGDTKYIFTKVKFTLKIPMNLDLATTAPLLCAGITVYSPMVQHGLQPHMTLGVVGIGGLGYMVVKIGKAMGCHVTVVSKNNAKNGFLVGLESPFKVSGWIYSQKSNGIDCRSVFQEQKLKTITHAGKYY